MTFYMDGGDRFRRTEMFACSAAYACIFMHYGYSDGFLVIGDAVDHEYRPGRTMSGTVAATNVVCIYHASGMIDDGMSCLDG